MDGKLWEEARSALAGVAELSHLKGGEGLDIYCLNSHEYRLDLQVRSRSYFTVKGTYCRQNEIDVNNFFNNIVPEGYLARLFTTSLLIPPQVRHPSAKN